jgi:hypothetical protein
MHHLRPLAKFFHELAVTVDRTAFWIGAFAEATYAALHYLRHVTIPHLIGAAVRPIKIAIRDIRETLRDVTTKLAGATAAVAATLNDLGWRTVGEFDHVMSNFVHAFAQLWRYVHGHVADGIDYLYNVVKVELAGATAGVQGALNGIDWLTSGGFAHTLTNFARAFAHLWRYVYGTVAVRLEDVYGEVFTDLKPFIDALKRGVIPAALLAGIVAALSRVWDGLFCRNTNAAGRELCALEQGLMDDFLAVLFGTAILLNFRQYVELEQRLMGATARGIKDILEV